MPYLAKYTPPFTLAFFAPVTAGIELGTASIRSSPKRAMSIASLKLIIDLSGKTIVNQELNNTDINSINISSIAKGLYLVKVENQSGHYFQSKLIVE